jgi:hypothetical protein
LDNPSIGPRIIFGEGKGRNIGISSDPLDSFGKIGQEVPDGKGDKGAHRSSFKHFLL